MKYKGIRTPILLKFDEYYKKTEKNKIKIGKKISIDIRRKQW